ncbi:PREDICTED: SWI/SNF-related matrix-associated actin-dependent regulator of chromatin subfamily A-like protein 1 [Ceratosolen solmsi marchali]|uniref:SWI/SNF-related matrix-associated actin-dependent regulator of chromatin subfamily A-like protein 1 n=1 Tax=Ceratosolen solmsi marchali TaxID=326594 RepID=A0AAJ6YB18_9HYME|nr:PREDICTED: SWI/SNF-related matrix-associated actin-dependent regulator of chromatin subfamily A-like protein 1 [Ceratosolen solmsi marchali]
MYSKEDIEKKRQQALQRKNQRVLSYNNVNTESIGTSRNVSSNQLIQNNTANSITKISNNYKIKGLMPNSNKLPVYRNYEGKSRSTIKLQSTKNRFNPVANTSKFYNIMPKLEVCCSMISNTRFTVDMKVFNTDLIDLFKTIPSKLYNFTNKTWNFHISDYDILREKVIGLKSDIAFIGLPSFLVKTFQNLLLQEKEPKKIVDLSDVDATLLNSLYPFQKQGIEYGISMNGRCLIADDMGLGKTRQALGIAAYYRKYWPLLIVTPSSLKYQWVEDIIQNLPSVPIYSIQHIITTKDNIDKSQIIIVSYDLLIKKIDMFAARKYGVIICDESHYLKSGKTQRTKAIQRLANSRHLILLTGTPALSRPIELYSQIKLLIPGFMSYQEFGIRYCGGVKRTFGWDFLGSTNSKELEILLKACCLIRRLKSEVMLELPSKIRENVVLDPQLIKYGTEEMKTASKNLERSLDSLQKKNALLQYYAATSKVKEKAVCNYVTDLIENQEKFLIFAHHQNMLDAISNLLTSKKILFIRIDGKTNSNQRKFYVDMFQEDDKILVAVLSILAANAGITMTAARLVIFAELSWNPGILAQAEDRVHRIGQTSNVVIRYLLAKSTADDHMWPAIQKKINVLNDVGLDQNFDLHEVDTSSQSSVLLNQEKLDKYIKVSSNTTSINSSSLDETGNATLHVSFESMRDLLDIDDDAFNDVNLTDIT